MAGCASAHVVHRDMGTGRAVEYTPPTVDRSVEVDGGDFEAALSKLVLDLPLYLYPSEAGRWVRASTQGETIDKAMQAALRKRYGRW
jgi:hypothetical protein